MFFNLKKKPTNFNSAHLEKLTSDKTFVQVGTITSVQKI